MQEVSKALFEDDTKKRKADYMSRFSAGVKNLQNCIFIPFCEWIFKHANLDKICINFGNINFYMNLKYCFKPDLEKPRRLQ